MELTGQQTIAAPRQRVWDALMDTRTLQAAIPGCEAIEDLGDGQLGVQVVAAIGPVKARFKGRLRQQDVHAPESYTLAFEGDGGVAAHPGIARALPALTHLAGGIAHPQVRHMGTIGGSVSNNDPSADYPGALLGLGARIETNRRTIAADDFFLGLFTTALEPGEILVGVRLPVTQQAGYCKIANPASGYVTAGAFVSRTGSQVRVDASAVAIGMFDGVHLGHRHVLARLREHGDALGVPTVVITFDPHPRSVVRANGAPPMLCGLDERLRLLRGTGAVDHCLVLHFDTKRAAEEAEDFVRSVLVQALGARALVVGANFACGKARRGNISELQRLGAAWGFSVHLQRLRPARPDDEQVACSSSEVRRLIALGEVGGAACLLGRPHALLATVEPGGATAGANLRLPAGMCLPPEGAYAVQVREACCDAAWRGAVLRIQAQPAPTDAALAHLDGEAVASLSGALEIRFDRRLVTVKEAPPTHRTRPMDSSRRTFLAASAAASLLPAFRASAAPQPFPDRSVRLIVPYPPGGTADILGRVLADHLSRAWGQPVVVDNRAGAGGAMGVDAVAKSAGDGYNLVLGVTGALTIAPALRKLPYDPGKDLTPISLVGSAPSMLALHPSVPANSVAELIALAKAQPGKLSFSSAGVGTSVHIAGEMFKSLAGVDLLHVPYKGGTPSVQALLGGEVSMTFENVPVLKPHVRAGALKGLAVTSGARSAVAPELPAIAETLKGYQVTTWFGLFAPAHTSAGIVRAIHAEVVRALAPEATRRRLEELGIDAVGSSPDELAAYMQAETVRFAKLVKQANITAE